MTESDQNRLVKAVEYYASINWKIIPCHGIIGGRCTCTRPHGEPKETGKHPAINEWNAKSTDDINQIQRWWEENADYNIGVHCSKSGFLVIDIDPRSGGPESFARFEEIVEGQLPPTVEAVTGIYTSKNASVRGRHLFYKCDPSESLVGNLSKEGLKGVDIKHNGYVLIAPSKHFSGVDYEWVEGREPWNVEMAEAPEELLSFLRKRSRKTSFSLSNGSWDWTEYEPTVDVDKMLKEGIEEGSRAVDIYKVSCALANRYGTDDMSRQFIETTMIRFNHEKVRPPLSIEGPNGLLQHVHNAIDFVAKNPKGSLVDENAVKWMQDRAQKIGGSSSSETEQSTTSLLGVVQPPTVSQGAPLPPTKEFSVETFPDDADSIYAATTLTNLDVPKDPDSLDERDGGDPGKRSLSDTGNGRRIVDRFGRGIRYTTGIGWFLWEEGYWKPDPESLSIQELAKRIPPIISSDIMNYPESQHTEVIKWAQQSRSNSRLNGAVESAKSDPRVHVPVEVWDKDDFYLGVLNGVIDLRTGELLKGDPSLNITRRAPVAYTSGHRNIRWQQFLDFATGGDTEYQEWLQRAAGYSITGLNKYDVMFLVYGPPGSGKNTFVEAIVKALGTKQYSWPLDSIVLAQGDGAMNNTDQYHMAELRGRRMVWVDELPDNERLKENSVKRLTGSSEIPARSPGGKPFNFESKAKLWISTNHRPIITDDAMWRRIRPIPFTFVPEKPDPDLKDYIFDPEGALPAVLAWAVEGAIKIYGSPHSDALGWCHRVSEAADVYKKNEDRIGIFLEEETIQSEGMTVSIESLYSVYRIWAESRGEHPLNQTNFQRKLQDRNIRIEGIGRSAVVYGYTGKPRPSGLLPNGETDWTVATRYSRMI